MQIPADIGIDDKGMRVVHTHDDTGRIHIEGPYPHDFYLKDFFTVWGKRFDNQCIMNYCVNDKHTLTVMVNGVQSDYYENILMVDEDVVIIDYRTIS